MTDFETHELRGDVARGFDGFQPVFTQVQLIFIVLDYKDLTVSSERTPVQVILYFKDQKDH